MLPGGDGANPETTDCPEPSLSVIEQRKMLLKNKSGTYFLPETPVVCFLLF